MSHGKNGSPTTCSNQAGKSPQHQAHNYSIFPGLGIVVRAARNGLKTALFIKRLGGAICAPDLQKSCICLATARFVENAVEQRGADATTPVLSPDSNVVDVKFAGRLPGDDITGDRGGLNGRVRVLQSTSDRDWRPGALRSRQPIPNGSSLIVPQSQRLRADRARSCE